MAFAVIPRGAHRDRPPRSAHVERQPMAWRSVAAVGVGIVGVLLALAGRYGYHRDELYFRVLAGAPAWGYVDQPPLTPVIARGALALFGDEVWAMRVPAALLTGALAVVLALLAREVGGHRTAQVVAAFGACSATPLVSGHLLLTSSLDWPLTVLVVLLVARALLRGRPGYWIAAGAVVGVALLNKLLVLLVVGGLVVGLLSVGPRRVLTTPWPWAAAVTALAVGSPTVVYQLVTGLPQVEMAGSLTGNAARVLFVPAQALALGPPAVPIWVAGLVALCRAPALRPLRWLAVAYGVACGALLVLGGQFYYTVGILLAVYAVGAVAAERWARDPVRLGHLHRTVVINTAASAVVALPLIPVSVLGMTPVPLLNPAAGDQVGWETYTDQVGAAWDSLTEAERERGVVIADNYGEAGAVDRFGPDRGLPVAVSGHNGLWALGRPDDAAAVAVVVLQGDGAEAFLAGVFERCDVTGMLDNGAGVANEEQATPVRVCRGPREPWRTLWPRFRYVGLSTFCEPCRRLNLV